MALIERGPNKPKMDLEDIITEFKGKLNGLFRAGMQSHEVQDALHDLNIDLDDISTSCRGVRVKVKEEDGK